MFITKISWRKNQNIGRAKMDKELKEILTGLKQGQDNLVIEVRGIKQDVGALKQDVKGLKQDVERLKARCRRAKARCRRTKARPR